MAYKLDKVNVSIQKYVSDILQFDIKNNNIGFITVTGVETTNDYSYSKIFVSFLDDKDIDFKMEQLEKSKGYIRSELAKKLTIRKCPDLIFVVDNSYNEGKHIEELLERIKK